MATGQQAEPQTSKLMDPVCGLRVEPVAAAGSRTYRERVYYFHSAACMAEFDTDPARFAGAGGDRTPDAAAEGGGPTSRADPVCGRRVMEVPDAPQATFDGVTYAFRSEACRREFLHRPEGFVSSISYEPGRHAAG